MPDRAARIDAFLGDAGWGGAVRAPLAGDASSRRYLRLARGADRAVLMDAPPATCGSQAPFLRMARHLRGLGLAAPECLASDDAAGLHLIEDLGDVVAAGAIASDPAIEREIYATATDILVTLQGAPCPAWAARYGPAEMAAAIRPAWEQYRGEGDPPSAGWRALEAALGALIAEHDMPTVLIHRDYHAENLVWRPECCGLARLGLLDFQDALAGHPAYDLASLLQDARRDVDPAIEDEMIARFAAARALDEDRLRAAYAVQATQRHLRILGIFARLARERGKPGYLRLVPRVWRDLMRNLDHPALASLRPMVTDLIPAPGAAP